MFKTEFSVKTDGNMIFVVVNPERVADEAGMGAKAIFFANDEVTVIGLASAMPDHSDTAYDVWVELQERSLIPDGISWRDYPRFGGLRFAWCGLMGKRLEITNRSSTMERRGFPEVLLPVVEEFYHSFIAAAKK